MIQINKMLFMLEFQLINKKKSGDLDRQVQTIINYAINQNPRNIETITDVGSGLNDNRKGLNKLLQKVMNDEVDRIFINYKDRLTRFGFNYLKTICDHHDVNIIIVSDEEPEHIEIKVEDFQANYLRTLPLHHSQKEVERTEQYTIFRFFLRPTFDFIQELLSLGNTTEILSPAHLRAEIAHIGKTMAKLNGKKKKPIKSKVERRKAE